jgi:hypothetical protein
MTKEKQAIEYIKKYRELDEKLYNTAPKGTVSSIATNKCLEFWDMAIKALEQEPMVEIDLDYVIKQKYIEREVLDKIRAEIMSLTDGDTPERIWNVDVLEIIDKYEKEQKGERL